eukprot:TRINITY_DN4972_c0_g1_i1.p1 TRINITY_DN4972_c0_g1~~TRINITY_DN4972_c0_g1_i1.p1  ORF type:complete len:423 (+),score=71.90 TRINITY_DN4972_c0_g1_i1:85-1353(+)
MFQFEMSTSPLGTSPLDKLKQPPQQMKILLLENISACAVEILKDHNFQIETLTSALSGEELHNKIKDVHAIGIRSKTKLTDEVLSHAKNLLCIGCFCIGTDQVDLVSAQKRGMAVFNSPFQNSRSVAELIIANVICLARQLGDRNKEMHSGIWNKTAKGCIEVRGKTLGIIGYGHIGSQLSVLAESMGMIVIYHDIVTVMPLGNSRSAKNLDDLLEKSDFVTLHVPDTPQTKNMITSVEIGKMKKGSFLLNASRGGVVVIQDLVDALKSGHLGGAYVDVYPEEPESNTKSFKQALQGCPNTILSPHIGGSTTEAQDSIGREVAQRFCSYLENGSSLGAVNFPEIYLPYGGPRTHRILNVHKNTPGVLKDINNILSVYNVESQVLLTKGSIGYLVADVEHEASETIHTQISALGTSLKTRILY